MKDDPPITDALDRLVGTPILGGQYVLGARIGRGAMGAVFRATQPSIGRTVAVKVLVPEAQSDEAMITRFNREARAASKLTHPNSVHVHMFGGLDDGTLFTVMEYLDGEDLGSLLVREAPLSIRRALRIILQALGALSEAHAMGIVHRDLKPPNVFLTTQGGIPEFVKVLDYGIAKMLVPDDPVQVKSLTQAGTVFGTPEYMSPEQARGERVDARADLYAVSVILYVSLAARHPFRASLPIDYLAKHAAAAPIPLRQQAPDVPEEIAAVVMRALAKRPEDRPQSAAEFASELIRAWRAASDRDPAIPRPELHGINLPPDSTDDACAAESDGAHGAAGGAPRERGAAAGASDPPGRGAGEDLPAAHDQDHGHDHDHGHDGAEGLLAGAGRRTGPLPAARREPTGESLDLSGPRPGRERGRRLAMGVAAGLVLAGAAAGAFFAGTGGARLGDAKIVVDTSPPGATATLDGRAASTTPARFDAVASGEHTLDIALAGRKPVSERITVSGSEEVVRRYTLEPAVVTLFVATTVPGAVIVADRDGRMERLGPPPAIYGSVPLGGSVAVEVHAPGFEPWIARLEPPKDLAHDARWTVEAKLARAGNVPELKAVMAELEHHLPAFRACLPKASTIVRTEMSLSIVGGAVTHARVLAQDMAGGGTGRCLEAAALEMSWPRIGAAAKANYIVPLVVRR